MTVDPFGASILALYVATSSPTPNSSRAPFRVCAFQKRGHARNMRVSCSSTGVGAVLKRGTVVEDVGIAVVLSDEAAGITVVLSDEAVGIAVVLSDEAAGIVIGDGMAIGLVGKGKESRLGICVPVDLLSGEERVVAGAGIETVVMGH
ncbi:hypothetical protein FCV25MIE_00490 [Fagus crenata]